MGGGGWHSTLLFYSNIPYFWLKMEEEELKIDNWVTIKEIWGRRMKNGGLRIKDWGWMSVDWGWAIKIWGFNHAKHLRCIFLIILCRESHYFQDILNFDMNFPLEDNIQLFPSPELCGWGWLTLYLWCW